MKVAVSDEQRIPVYVDCVSHLVQCLCESAVLMRTMRLMRKDASLAMVKLPDVTIPELPWLDATSPDSPVARLARAAIAAGVVLPDAEFLEGVNL